MENVLLQFAGVIYNESQMVGAFSNISCMPV
jgi:hypothetical protein